MNRPIVLESGTNSLLKAAEVAKILNISRSLTYRLFQEGKIPTIRINKAVRVMPKDLITYIQICRHDFKDENSSFNESLY